MKYRATIAYSSLRPAVHNRSGAKRTREIGCVAISCPFFYSEGMKRLAMIRLPRWFVKALSSPLATPMHEANRACMAVCVRVVCFVHMVEQCTVRAPIWWSKWWWTCPFSRCGHFVTIGVARKSSLLLFFSAFRWNDSTLCSSTL